MRDPLCVSSPESHYSSESHSHPPATDQAPEELGSFDGTQLYSKSDTEDLILAGGAVGEFLNRKRLRGVEEVLPDPKSRCLGPEDLEAEITFDNIDEPFDVRGHFSDLYLGTHRKRGRVALKRLRPWSATESEKAAWELLFCKAASIWMKLRHDRIIECLGAFKCRGNLYFVLPFMQNGTLWDWIKPETQGTERLRLISELSDAVGYIHSENIVHGHLRASKVLLSDDLHVQLCNSGLTQVSTTRTDTMLHRTGGFRWQSPELWKTELKTFQSDVYAFGMTIVEILTGKPPFASLKNDSAVMMAVLRGGDHPSKVPLASPDGTSYAPAWDVAEKCWHHNARKRISMETVAEFLRRQTSTQHLTLQRI